MQIFSVFRKRSCRKDRLDLELAGIRTVLELCREERLFRNGGIYKRKSRLLLLMASAMEEHDQEGRVITLEYEDFYFVTVYTPNSQSELARLDYRMKWEDDFLAYLKELEEKKPVVFCGDLNVAHQRDRL